MAGGPDQSIDTRSIEARRVRPPKTCRGLAGFLETTHRNVGLYEECAMAHVLADLDP